MERLYINGGRRLSGEISVDGSKNAALPILFASIATRGVSRIDNLPDIVDVDIALQIISFLGASVRREGKSVLLDTRNLTYKKPPCVLTASLRASTYLIGACLARFGRAELSEFGGCSFGLRPIDMHVSAAETLGARLCGDELICSGLTPGYIIFKKISVGATVNALIMCASCQGESRIYGYAREPHVFSLIDFLRNSGADIKVNEDFLSISGGTLRGSYSYIIPDMIEAGTYLSLSVATDSDVSVIGADKDELASYSDFLRKHGSIVECGDGFMRAREGFKVYAELKTGPYPLFPTDLQPQMAPLLAKCLGGRIVEGVWRERFAYLSELSRLGVKYRRFDGGADIITSSFTPGIACATDLRGGAALLITALAAKGESIINSAELIRRGYSNIEAKLSRVGAVIKRIT